MQKTIEKTEVKPAFVPRKKKKENKETKKPQLAPDLPKQGGDGQAGPAAAAAGDEGEYISRHVSALRMVEALFSALTNADQDGRVVVTYDKSCNKSEIKFQLLNPVRQCRRHHFGDLKA